MLSDQQAPITSYTVHYMVKGSSLNTTVADINPNTSRFMVPNVSAEDEYYIKVVAVNSAGSSPAAAVVASECRARTPFLTSAEAHAVAFYREFLCRGH